ncbi:MAG: amidase family protein, partial [Pseudomonadota bacterium]
SMIRPASYCGVYGFKPTRGMISRSGVLQTSVSLDQIGTFGRTLADAALLADVIGGYDQNDPASFPRPRPSAADGVSQEVPVAPDFSWLDLPYFDRLADDAREGLEEVISLLEAQVKRETAANTLSDLVRVQACIHEYEICQHQAEVFKNSWELISDTLKPIIERGQKISAEEYEDSLEVKRSAESFFDEFFTEFDAIIAPAAPGEAPPFGKNTGDPIFSTIWTLAGLPCVTLPLLVGANDLPIGVQLIGPKERDDRLMRTANWLQQHLTAEAA